MIKTIGHIGIVVTHIEETAAALARVLGVPTPPVRDVADKQMKVALLELDGFGFELIEDYGENGPYAHLARERGNFIHHFCFVTDDMQAEIETLRERGVEMADLQPRMGLRGKPIAFTKPSALNGIAFELSIG